MANELTMFEQLEHEAREGYLTREVPYVAARIHTLIKHNFISGCTNWEAERAIKKLIEQLEFRMENAEGIQKHQAEENRKRSLFNLPPLHVYDQADYKFDMERLGFLKELELFVKQNASAHKRKAVSFSEWFNATMHRVGYLIDWDHLSDAFAVKKAREIVLAQCATWSPRQFILEFQRKRIEEMQAATVGPDCEFVKKKTSTSAFLDQLRSVEARVQALIDADPANDIFLRVLHEVRSKIAAVTPVHQTMIAFEQKAAGFLNDQLAKIAMLEDSLHKLETIHEARMLCDSTDQVISDAEQAITDGVITLATGFQEMHEQIARAYEESGIALAVDVSGQGKLFDTAVMDRLIAQYVPAKLEVEKKVS
ncbi:hypothetical protein A3E97_01000 [Candidatus Uhrbacteria bacterium RIFCSPHIGHO2_12_FULL_47_12]|nr:MAG: hypothetical protein A3E97_01000 [Candidatus Uhrbacteria bacterium RIFCSPHIGHO2_12_FULL_47_12]OGL82284.1 MAG: hypothetical protein A3B20_00840 [Candidatus Uhrbacteria bacterium RIFCSPLOWO2_01_FULL_47_17]